MQANKISIILCATLLAFAAPGMAADDGEKIFADACADCHHPKKRPLDKTHMTREKWKENIDNMIEKDKLDPPLKKDEYSVLLDWLATTHGPTGAAADSGKQ